MDEHEKIHNEIVQQGNVSVRAANVDTIAVTLHGRAPPRQGNGQLPIPKWLRNTVGGYGIDPNDDQAIQDLLVYNGIYNRGFDSDEDEYWQSDGE